jgi:LETM1 and EF-hand domain-containing protein 1, mitochondrial
MKKPEDTEEDLAFKEMTDDTAREELRKAKEHDKTKLCNVISVVPWLTVC